MSVPWCAVLFQDPAWIMYMVSIVVSGFASLLFIWWWVQTRSPSEVYLFVTLLLVGNTVSDMIAFHSRTLYLLDHNAFLHFSTSPIWWVRRVPETLIILFLIIKMVIRIKRTIEQVENLNSGLK